VGKRNIREHVSNINSTLQRLPSFFAALREKLFLAKAQQKKNQSRKGLSQSVA
jgi:hypothetical protein